MSIKKKMLQAAAGVGGSLDIADAFSTDLYTGNGAAQTITNGIDLSGEGGLVWEKTRYSASYNHNLVDTVRGERKILFSNSTNAEVTTNSALNDLTSFNSDGFSLGSDEWGMNASGQTHVAWTFRKAPKFFDVVTYTGTGDIRTIAHDLGVAPGWVVVKRLDSAEDWRTWHRGLDTAFSGRYINLNSASPQNYQPAYFTGTDPTDAVFSLGTNVDVNASGGSYVAYVFAHDTDDDSVIQCGSYTGNGSATGPTVTLGWEPQWLLVKNASTTRGWYIFDSARGLTKRLEPNSSGAEATTAAAGPFDFQATGFQPIAADVEYNRSGDNYIYMAIRAEA
jgi:hypothetical protein